jgi:short-subunit dehydrogenase
MSFIKDRIVFITGATGGLGKEMVKQFAVEGAKLIITDTNKENLAHLSETIYSKESILHSFVADLSTNEGCIQAYEEIKTKSLPIDFLINNAGVASVGPFITTPQKDWELQYSLNLLAPVRLTKLFLPDLLERKSGHIVFIASVASYVPAIGLSTYSSTKHGLRAFGESLSEELKSKNIKVSNLYPFFTKTPMMDSPQYGYSEKKAIPDFLMSTPEDVIADLIKGIKADELHIFPGLLSRTSEFISRYIPQGLNFFLQYLR